MLCNTICNNNKTNKITDSDTLQFIHKLHNFIHIISMHSNEAAITLSGYDSAYEFHIQKKSKTLVSQRLLPAISLVVNEQIGKEKEKVFSR